MAPPYCSNIVGGTIPTSPSKRGPDGDGRRHEVAVAPLGRQHTIELPHRPEALDECAHLIAVRTPRSGDVTVLHDRKETVAWFEIRDQPIDRFAWRLRQALRQRLRRSRRQAGTLWPLDPVDVIAAIDQTR